MERATGPVGNTIRRTGLTADHLTGVGLALAAVTAVVVAQGRLIAGMLLLVASALPDLLDGAVAKASGTASPRGAFFDSVADRVSDSLVLGGVAWHLASSRGGHAALLPFAVLGVSTLISYERAKAESLGYQAKGGLMERAERIIALCVGLTFGVLVPVLWLMLVLTGLTAAHRFGKVWRQASAPRPEKVIDGRWRAWRASYAVGGLRPRRPARTERERPWRRGSRAGARPRH